MTFLKAQFIIVLFAENYRRRRTNRMGSPRKKKGTKEEKKGRQP